MLVLVMAAELCQFSFVHHGDCNLEHRQDENCDEDRPRRWGGSGGNAGRRMTLHGSFLKLGVGGKNSELEGGGKETTLQAFKSKGKRPVKR